MSVSTLPASLLASWLISVCCLAQTRASSDEPSDLIVFRNGDRLSGHILTITEESIAFDNTAIGKITIPWNTVLQVESSDRLAVMIPRDAPREAVSSPFQTASLALIDGNDGLSLDIRQQEKLLAGSTLTFQDSSAPRTRSRPPSRPPSTPDTSDLRWSLNVNAPYTIVSGTENQQTFGGILAVDVFEGKLNHSKLAASGTHNRTWEVASPFVTTDVFDAFFQQGRSFGGNRGGLYGKAEAFFNTSLGMAMQKSVGGGYYSRPFSKGPFQFNWLADLRYFNERLYGTANSAKLIGSRIEGQVAYRKKDSSDPAKIKYSIIFKNWVNPMWNNESALQAYTMLQLSMPFGRSVCLAFSPIEDDYLRNAPAGKRKNYFSSSLALKIEHGSNPNQRCY